MLFRSLKIERANQVWATDITYIPMACGWVYLCAIVDWASRRVLSHRVSISMDSSFCVDALEEAFAKHGQAEIFNTDQGSQFTSDDFTGALKARGVAISMDGKGAWRDNVFVERLRRSIKYEEVVCYERNRCNLDGSGALPKMRVGPSESACRSRLQTATSCVG